jgi:type IV secretion system protein VirB10
MADQDTSKTDHVEPNDEVLPEVQQELSKVATNPKQHIFILIAICLVFAYFLFYLLINNKSSEKETQVAAPTEVTKPVVAAESAVPPIPQLPEPPKLVEPVAPVEAKNSTKVNEPESPPPLPVAQDNSTLNQVYSAPEATLPSKLTESDDAKKRKETKRKSAIVLVAGAPQAKTQEQIDQETDFKTRGNMGLILGRGKIIDAILETGINSDIGGEIRAVISRDVYSESGHIVLIPKGSRIFGGYNIGGNNGVYGRVVVEWNRIDLVTGYSVNIQAPAVDNLGKRGVQGRVDNKITERMSNAILMSAFNITLADVLDKIVTPPVSAQAATTSNAAASQLNNIANSIVADPTTNATTKINLICTQVQAAIPDKTSTAYTTFATACATAITAPSASANQTLTGLLASVNAAATALLTNTNAQITPTQQQSASKQSFTDVTDLVKQLIEQNKFTPTTTIEQGTPIKIYVTKDYKFPRGAITKSRLMQ